ncbi:unnamed protein product [Paramecium primaurelia]|uniref:Histidine kinase n=1 Tax=Paramecium primaurelia TaxID=5886 RepID=A0A8S1M7S9_PARPR|nr:unnamed protein product [Paramecium primaurelia]
MHYYNSSQERKWIIVIQILLTYILHIEIQIPQFDFAHPLYYGFLICRNKLKLWMMCVNLLFIAFYCIIRLFYELEQQVIWTIIHYTSTYAIFVIFNLQLLKEENQKAGSQLVEIYSNTERYRWKESNFQENFQENYARYLCFNQIREGVILFEQGYEKQPTFINQSAKKMFSFTDETQLQQIFQNYVQIDKMEPKRSMQSIKSFGVDRQNSIFHQLSGSLSQHSRPQSVYKPQQKDISFSQLLDKAWNNHNKERHLFYLQQCKQSSQSQYSPIFEVNVYINSQFRRIMTLVCRDLSYKQYIQQLQCHSNYNSKMISFVSHEFRAPLGCMITMLEYVAKDLNNSYIQTSIENSKYLLNLCNDLLDLAQIKANKFQLKIEKFNLKKLCQECFQMFNLQAEKKNLKLILQYSTQCPTMIESDQSRIKQIVINLLGNAFKFTQEGYIIINVEVLQDSVIEITIQDTGIGIQEQDKEILMMAFGKVNSEESKKLNAQGVGLGLLISNKIALLLGNGLKFDSTYHKGSNFSFTINLPEKESFQSDILKQLCNKQTVLKDSEIIENLNEVEESSKEIQIFISQPKKSLVQVVECCTKILIVDDTQFNIDTLQILLSKIGIHQVDYSINGYKAIEKIKQKEKCCKCDSRMYKLIFMDLEMLGINGINASKLIFTYCEENGIQLPIIVACSGHQKEIEFPKCQQIGMKFYLEKPVQIKALQGIIDHYRNSL